MAMVAASYVLAAINFGFTHLPWRQGNNDLLLPMNHVAGVVGTISFLGWLLTAVLTFQRYRRKAWPILLGAPFALATFLDVILYLVVATLLDHP